jgi:hypothetical protein
MKRYILHHAITGQTIGSAYTTQSGAEKAAKRYSLTPLYAGQSLGVWWRNDTGVPKREVAYVYRGQVMRT